MATDNFWGKFRRWRRHRPFWGGLFLLLSAVELYLSANLTLGGLEVHLGPQGFLSYVLPAIILVSGILVWVTPAQRLFYGIVALLAALYSFLGLNLGGFFIGMLLGILGGALVIAWGPPRPKPGAELEGLPPTGEPTDLDEDEPQDAGDDIFGERDDTFGEREDIEKTQQIEVAGHDDRPHEQVRPATRSFDETPPAGGRTGMARFGRSPKAIVLAIVPVAVTATILVVGGNMPASAEECPEGLPSRSTAATTTTAASKEAAVAKKKVPPATKKTTAATATGGATATETATKEAADEGTGDPIVDGISDLVDGVSNLLGINDEESSSPSESPSPSETATETKDPEPTATTTKPDETSTATATATTTAPADGTTTATKPASVQPTASGDDIPCLGARVYGKVASADDIPSVATKPGLMEVDSLTMYDSTYDGVVDMPKVGGGTFKALKFSMNKAVNKPFSLTIDEPNGSKTHITSKELTTAGTVKFYTPEFKGNLFGLIPVTFTPDSPPPLTLPILWFTNAKIQLAYVRCDTLTGDPLKVQG